MLLSLIALLLIGATRLVAQPDSAQSALAEPLSLEAGGTLIEGYVDWTQNGADRIRRRRGLRADH